MAKSCYSQNSFDSLQLPSGILAVLQQFPETNNNNPVKFDTVSIKGMQKLRHLKNKDYLILTNHRKASVRMIASKYLIEKDFTAFWQTLAKNAADTTDWFLCQAEDKRIPMTLIDYLLNNFGVNTPEHFFSESQIQLIASLKEERKKHLINYYINHAYKE
ncbi:hypothetical protein [Ferruginibacter albus]|uniref:hypothetical protein n=1 Tax=Ferruginibacter albus TaxID=2875540 RepID=UPI001CC398FF|nr:hypothetical protein [Ferruginibacter albus]UAY53136.1 hypothetical protein K9M53_05535 [Ferruginibacter albus]